MKITEEELEQGDTERRRGSWIVLRKLMEHYGKQSIVFGDNDSVGLYYELY